MSCSRSSSLSWEGRMAAPVRQIDQFLSLLSKGTQIYLNTCSCLDCTSSFYPFLWLSGPQSPPKLVRPFQEVETFDRNVSNTIHKNLVTRRHTSKDKPGFQARIPKDKTKFQARLCPKVTSLSQRWMPRLTPHLGSLLYQIFPERHTMMRRSFPAPGRSGVSSKLMRQIWNGISRFNNNEEKR